MLATRMLYPPVDHCQNPLCPRPHPRLLRHKDEPRSVVLFTLGHGSQDAYSIHLYCFGMFTVRCQGLLAVALIGFVYMF